MLNPQEQELPSTNEPVLRVKALASHLAYGALNGLWNVELPEALNPSSGLGGFLRDKWKDNYPSNDLLASFGYLSTTFRYGSTRYSLTQKAFELLEKIPPKTKIFISYGREFSSAFALALSYKLASDDAEVFLDRELDLGEGWHARLESKIKESDYFICILSPKTLESKNVRKEIQWAQESDRYCIPVWHLGFSVKDVDSRSDLSPEVKLYINAKNACVVDGKERAAIYHNAINSILNQLGSSEK